MRITEAAQRLGTSARMLRYRDSLGLLPPVREAPAGDGHRHRRFWREELDAVTAALRLEQRYGSAARGAVPPSRRRVPPARTAGACARRRPGPRAPAAAAPGSRGI